MPFRDYIETYNLVRNINDYRESQMKEIVDDENEFDENYYRCDDVDDDKRGNF